MKGSTNNTLKRVIEATLYTNRWIPNGRSTLGKYIQRFFVLDLNKSYFACYNDSTKSKLRGQYSLEVLSSLKHRTYLLYHLFR